MRGTEQRRSAVPANDCRSMQHVRVNHMAAGRASLESRQKLPRPLVVPSFRSASRGPSAARVAQMWLRQPRITSSLEQIGGIWCGLFTTTGLQRRGCCRKRTHWYLVHIESLIHGHNHSVLIVASVRRRPHCSLRAMTFTRKSVGLTNQ
jgi:hypothetical protein